MTTTRPLESVPSEGPRDPSAERAAESLPHRPRRRERRFEFGFFVRKIVKGRLAYYKSFPPTRREIAAPEPPPPPPSAPDEEQRSDGFDGAVLRSTSHPKPDDDTGPIGETRIEAGVFFRSVTEPAEPGGDDE